uniref:Myoferlin like n=1 Tax=Oryzias latipes TaxID=8090 RepID=H2LS40_ORYLA
MLRVIVECAKGIPKKKLGNPDPITTVVFREKKKTKAVNSELNPVWNEILEFDLDGSPLDASSFIDVVVKDYETFGKHFIGSSKILLGDLAGGHVASLPSKNVPLINEKQQIIGATISLLIVYEKPSNADDQKPLCLTRKRNKPLASEAQDFQIRVRVIEGRHLPGIDIKPVVRVLFDGKTHRTNVRGGNNPFFDEMFFYNVNMSLSDLSDEHAIMRKWLLLKDPDDSTMGARGYLKVSIIIMGTGDEAPIENRLFRAEQDDLESNLLVPAGVSMRTATLSLKVYRAEDMPQDDATVQTLKQFLGGEGDKKNLVDPYLEVSFAGKKVCTKIIQKNANPEWNQLISLNVKDDVIGTTFLNLSQISHSGGNVEVGFLPAFGPCFVNLYGSPREYGDLPDRFEELNFGNGEGVAYRGRVLVELSTHLDKKVEKNVDDIPRDDVLVAQFQRRRRYSLCSVFHSACMLQEPGGPIRFEVTLGNYGNKLDSTCKPLVSTTPNCFAVFDNHYYYLPWADTKPVVILTSYWEDISHRLDAINILLFTADQLESNLNLLKTAISAKEPESRLTEIWLKLLDHIIEELVLPALEDRLNVTVLDLQKKNLREAAVYNIMQMACCMKEEARDIGSTVADIEDWLDRIKQLAEEPQNSMPDVIIWMFRGEKRVAYARVPANQILYSSFSKQACGKHCGKIQTIFMQYPMDKNKGVKIPAELRFNMWLGLSVHEKEFSRFSEGNFSICVEMYENQALLGKWGTAGLINCHKFSDVTGKIKLKQELFLPPQGWEWEGSLLAEADAGCSKFTDEVFQNEIRFPGGEWKPAAELYTDLNGEKVASPKEFECPPGWTWEDDWSFDSNRAVDERWEYGVTLPPNEKPSSWVAAEKTFHVHRRRRLIRPRRKLSGKKTVAKRRDSEEGWEYSSLFGSKFHIKERCSDTFRRRRWRRNMIPSHCSGCSAIFKLEGVLSKTEEDKLFGAKTPTVSCHFSSYIYHLRVYIYQGRNLCPMDHNSFSPYAHVSFLHMSKTTHVIQNTLNPIWDQTLIFEDIEIHGDPQTVASCPPEVVLELYDSDQVGKDEPMGHCKYPPLINLQPNIGCRPKLQWLPITKKGHNAGELLLAAELLLKLDDDDLPIVPPRRSEKLYMVPQGIKPVVQLTAIEQVLTWGLRNMEAFQLSPVSSPSLIVECGGETVKTAIIKNFKKNPNFPGSVLLLKLLPKEEMYAPPIVLKVIDHKPFGWKPVVGQCTIRSLGEFRCDPYRTNSDICMSSRAMMADAQENVVIDVESRAISETRDEAVDWWSKFYSSLGEQQKCNPYLRKGYDTLKVYNCELEKVEQFQGLTDFCRTINLHQGKTVDDDEDPSVVGQFKQGSFKIYPLSDDPSVPAPPCQFKELPESGPQECLVRIYVVRCIEVQSKDSNGKCDPYIKITLGKKTLDDRDNYKPNTLSPEFGMFELSCTLPQDKDLKIAVYDFDKWSRDEEVGETVIDLEDRLLSYFRPCCGLPQTYCSGVNQWRDQLKPSQILQNVAKMRGVPPPSIEEDGRSLLFSGKRYHLQDFANILIHSHLGPEKERLSLHVLRNLGLVPEHVETRTLSSSYKSNLSQGRIQMWVDIFPKRLGLPGPPCEISPRKAKYFLRVIIWNTSDVILDDASITAEKTSDIYVKQEQFWNWDKTEYRNPPKLIVQIWDNDRISLDDYLSVELDLLRLVPPAKTPEKCTLKMLPGMKGTVASKAKPTSLFSRKSVRGWWPCANAQNGSCVLTQGKVEMTLEIVDEKEAEERPAGRGRNEPNMNPKLDPPRPATSFAWFTNVSSILKFMTRIKFRWIFVWGVLLVLAIFFLGIMFLSIPSYFAMKIVKPLT